MLRWVVGLLLVANGVYYAWTQGHLAPLGFTPTEQREPERLEGQIQPDVLRLLNAPRPEDAPQPPAEAATKAPLPVSETTTASAAPAPPDEEPLPSSPGDPTPVPSPPSPPAPALATACWQASGFDEAEADALRRALPRLGLPKGSWRFEETRSGGRWVVYMGRYQDELLERKKEELRDLKIEFRTLSAPPLGPGLALGTFSSEDAAEQGLKNVTRKGVRSARVAQERDPSISVTLRLPAITSEERAMVQSLGSALAGKTLRSCGG
jgi:hypothetical protein